MESEGAEMLRMGGTMQRLKSTIDLMGSFNLDNDKGSIFV
jgi:hypothetical protein